MAEDTKQQDNQLQPEAQSSNRRIAKNALMLYIRMFLTMIVGLYTSRVVLATLGVEDYGIYGVVGGVVAMMGFLNASMSGATSRFLTFELGRGDQKRLADTFSSALIVHIGIAIVVFILAETVGLWFLCNKLVIPEGRMNAAHWVYQCSILSAMLGITQAPYNASIIAHEKMDVYAYVEILNVTLKLLIVYLLVIGNFDKLKLYAILVLAVSVTIMLIYRIYCIRKFKECHFHWLWNKEILKPLLSFSGWNLIGRMCGYAENQGTNFLLNIFFGVVSNAASYIVTTINGMVLGFSSNICMAFQPQIVKQYSKGEFVHFSNLIKKSSKFTLIFFQMLLVPCFIETHCLIQLWLGNVPTYSVEFLRCILLVGFLDLFIRIINDGINATGKNRSINCSFSFCYILTLILGYYLFQDNYEATFIYVAMIISRAILLCLSLVIIFSKIKRFNVIPILVTYIEVGVIVFINFGITRLISTNLNDGVIRLILVSLSSFLNSLLLMFTFMGKDMRLQAKQIILNKIKQCY